MNYGSEPADQIVRYSLEGAEFALRISGTAAKNFFIFAQDDAAKANRIIEKLQLDVVDTGTAELVDAVQQNLENAAPNHKDTLTVDFPLGSENASPSEPFSDSSKSFANSPSPRADLLRAKGERPSVRMELQDITAYLRNRAEAPKDRMPKLPVKIRRKEKVM